MFYGNTEVMKREKASSISCHPIISRVKSVHLFFLSPLVVELPLYPSRATPSPVPGISFPPCFQAFSPFFTSPSSNSLFFPFTVSSLSAFKQIQIRSLTWSHTNTVPKSALPPAASLHFYSLPTPLPFPFYVFSNCNWMFLVQVLFNLCKWCISYLIWFLTVFTLCFYARASCHVIM